MNIFILTQALKTGDAVGNDIIQEHKALSSAGHVIKLYAEGFDDYFLPFMVKKEKLYQSIKKEDAIILYHHSTFWKEGEEIINRAKCKIFLRYHNVTTESFFKSYSDFFSNIVRQGREQTRQFILSGKISKYIADSEFNAFDLIENGVSRDKIEILAPFHLIDDFKKTKVNLHLLEELLDGRVNILSVGRMVPNKGHSHIIKIIDHYVRHYGDHIRLLIIGDTDANFQKYYYELEDLVYRHNLEKFINFRGKVSFTDLHTYYTGSHVMLVMSEHEGFCLPILEAQYHRLPVIALDRCAVKSTLGKEQLSVKEADYNFFAAAINIIANDNDIRNYLSDYGFKNYLNYNYEILSKKFIGIFDEKSKR